MMMIKPTTLRMEVVYSNHANHLFGRNIRTVKNTKKIVTENKR